MLRGSILERRRDPSPPDSGTIVMGTCKPLYFWFIYQVVCSFRYTCVIFQFYKHSRYQPSHFSCRPSLPEFDLDFSHVVYSQVVSRTVTLTNTGYSPVSFTTAHSALEHTGFSLDLGERIHSLPEFESLEFTVRFDPAAIRCPEGHVEARLPFNVSQ